MYVLLQNQTAYCHRSFFYLHSSWQYTNHTGSFNQNFWESSWTTDLLGVTTFPLLPVSSPGTQVFYPNYVLSSSPTLLTLYNTLILPYLNYSNIVWAGSNSNQLHSLITIQKRAIRICSLSQPRDHTAPLFARLHTLTLADINKLQTGIFMYKYINKLLPPIFSNYFTSVQDIHGYSTRSRDNLFIPFTRTSYSINTLRFHGPCLWNGIDRVVQT